MALLARLSNCAPYLSVSIRLPFVQFDRTTLLVVSLVQSNTERPLAKLQPLNRGWSRRRCLLSHNRSNKVRQQSQQCRQVQVVLLISFPVVIVVIVKISLHSAHLVHN